LSQYTHIELIERPPRPDELTILLYHGVTRTESRGIENFSGKHLDAEEFAHQMRFVRAHTNPLTIDQVVEHILEQEPFPERATLVSFDDGFANNHDVAAPILADENIPAVFYITSGLINSTQLFWLDVLEACINAADAGVLRIRLETEREFELAGLDSRIEALAEIKGHCKRSSTAEKDRVVEHVRRETGVEPDTSFAENYRMMTWRELRSMADEPLFTIGGHSLYHDILSSKPKSDMERDIDVSLDLLEINLNRPITHYSYPDGQRHHYNQDVIDKLKQRGIVCSPSAVEGYCTLDDDLFHLQRTMVGYLNVPFPFPDYEPRA